jgi:hypothetical protein
MREQVSRKKKKLLIFFLFDCELGSGFEAEAVKVAKQKKKFFTGLFICLLVICAEADKNKRLRYWRHCTGKERTKKSSDFRVLPEG